MPFEKTVSDDGKDLQLFGGIATSTDLDRDNERMGKSIIPKIAKSLDGATVFFNHDTKGLGVGKVLKSEVSGSGDRVMINVIPTKAAKMADVVTQINEGILKSFSIGGRILKFEDSYDKVLKKDVKVITDVEIYEVSVVGIPANKNASITNCIAKSFKIDGDKMGDEEKVTPPADDKKPAEEEKKEASLNKSVMDDPHIQKALSDLKVEYSKNFTVLTEKIEKEYTAKVAEMKKEFDEAKVASDARLDAMKVTLDGRVKSIQTDKQALEKQEGKKDETVEKNAEPHRYLQ